MGLKFFCFFILSIFACTKVNQWKQPTKVCFNINIVEETVMDGALFFKEGYVAVESFQFDGKREEGADVYFTKYYEQVLNTTFGAASIDDLAFDVPQGTYTDISLEVVSKTNNGKPNLVINGFFTNKEGKTYPVCFELDEKKAFSMVGKDFVEKGKRIDLSQITKTKATILLNPTKWFSGLTKGALEQAEKISIKGINTILINHAVNKQLYNDIVASLEKDTAEAIFVKQS